MKVLQLVGFSPDIGGPYTTVRNLTHELSKIGCQTGICSVVPAGYDKPETKCLDHLEDLICIESDNLISRFWTSYTPELWKFLARIKEYDLVHINGIFDYYSWFIYKNVDLPFIVSPHGTLQSELFSKRGGFKKKVFLSLVGNRILKSAAYLHALTVDEKRSLENLSMDSHRIEVLPNGIYPEEFNDMSEKGLLFDRYPDLKDKEIVLFLGRINWKKGLDDLIPAFSKVVKTINNAHLLIVGPNSEGYMAKVSKWVKTYGLEEHITYTGPAYGEEKLMFLQDSDLFILPSYSEGFPMSVLEAMYMGLPVIITENSGIPDIVRNNNAGLVINKNSEEISSSLIKLLSDKGLSSYMGKNGRNVVEERFTWDKIATKMLKLYENALK